MFYEIFEDWCAVSFGTNTIEIANRETGVIYCKAVLYLADKWS